jgi:hypothetical protein
MVDVADSDAPREAGLVVPPLPEGVRVTRARLIRRGAGGLLMVSAFGATDVSVAFARSHSGTLSPADVNAFKLGVQGESLWADFSRRALTSGQLDAAGTAHFKNLFRLANAAQARSAQVITQAGLVPPVIPKFRYNPTVFQTATNIWTQSAQLAQVGAGTYLGLVTAPTDTRTRASRAQRAIEHATALGYANARLGRAELTVAPMSTVECQKAIARFLA